jgi:hypothetical protein
MSLPELDNLVRIGQLKAEARNENAIWPSFKGSRQQ